MSNIHPTRNFNRLFVKIDYDRKRFIPNINNQLFHKLNYTFFNKTCKDYKCSIDLFIYRIKKFCNPEEIKKILKYYPELLEYFI